MTPRVRRGGVGPLPSSAYVDTTSLELPESVANLEVVPGICQMAKEVGTCDQATVWHLCVDCSLAEIGESWELLTVRTNAGTPKAVFYRNLDKAQSMPDPSYRRLMEWKRKQDPRG